VTSLELGRTDKTKIATIFTPHIRSESDVFGNEDIQDLLSKHSEVVKSHPALWLASAEVLSIIHNAAILGRSDFSLEEIRQKARRYVPTTSHSAAKAKLEATGAVLITGLPGIGKTTLAEQLCLEYVLGDYQLCVLGEAIEEAEGIYKSNELQIFYFDDFLGRNYLEALGRHEDSRIVGFIRRVQKDAKKRFVLTSRTTVLNQAKYLSDQFDIAKLDRTELEIHLEGLSRMDRARILHKHLWYSELRSDVLREMLRSRRYVDVVEHKNFNPRLIQFITDAQRFDADDPSKYWTYVQETLSNPSAIWQHVLDGQLDDYSRSLLLLCCFNGSAAISEAELRAAFARLKEQPIARTFEGNGEFIRNSRLVTGSVLSRTIVSGQNVQYTLFNPSIADHVFSRYAQDGQLLIALLSSLLSRSSLQTLESLKENNIVPAPAFESVVEALFTRYAQASDLDVEYRWRLASISLPLLASKPSLRPALVQAASALVRETDNTIRDWESLAATLSAYMRAGLITSVQAVPIFDAFEDSPVLRDETISLGDLYSELDEEEREAVLPGLKAKVVDFWEDSVMEEFVESGEADGYLSEDEVREVSKLARDFVADQLAQYPFDFTAQEVDSIHGFVDAYEVISKNQSRQERDHSVDDLYPTPRGPALDEIDELFNIDLPRSS
jgi:adenylate kinase family enzyme